MSNTRLKSPTPCRPHLVGRSLIALCALSLSCGDSVADFTDIGVRGHTRRPVLIGIAGTGSGSSDGSGAGAGQPSGAGSSVDASVIADGGNRSSTECSSSSPCRQPDCQCLDLNFDGLCDEGCLELACVEGRCVSRNNAAARSCGAFASTVCAPGEMCLYVDSSCGRAGGIGTCMRIPDTCQDARSAVCGCDGRTYLSACEANRAGVSVASGGECIARR